MATKKCAYRGCGSYTSSSRPSAETFYAFPKDPDRLEIWLRLGGCQNEIPLNMRYFCSRHFDETKYVARNPRRKQLLSTAIPWPHSQSPDKEIAIDEVDYQCVVSTIDDNEHDDETSMERFHGDSVSIEVTNQITNISETIEEALQDYGYDDDTDGNEFRITLPVPTEKKKRKLESQQCMSTSEKSIPSIRNTVNRATSSTISIANEDEADKSKSIIGDFDEDKLLESSNVTTFIFKGEEYIQMPKDEYVCEKMALIQKIKSYEEVFKNIKHLMEGVST